MGRFPAATTERIPASIVARARGSSETSRSPASSRTSDRPMSIIASLQLLDDGDLSASRIAPGAAAAPRLYDELASYGIPTRTTVTSRTARPDEGEALNRGGGCENM